MFLSNKFTHNIPSSVFYGASFFENFIAYSSHEEGLVVRNLNTNQKYYQQIAPKSSLFQHVELTKNHLIYLHEEKIHIHHYYSDTECFDNKIKTISIPFQYSFCENISPYISNLSVHNNYLAYCIDFQYRVLYKVIEKYIKNQSFKTFSKVEIVRTDVKREDFKIFKRLNVSNNTGKKFIQDTCLYANTVHFNVGELPDLYCHTTPILSKSYIFNNYKLPEIRKDTIFNSIYPEIKFDKNISYSQDLEKYYKGELTSWQKICNEEENLKLIKSSNNYKNVFKVVEDIISVLYNIDNEV